MHTMKCPKCRKKIRLISFGNAWIGMCNFEIVYHKYELPPEKEGG